MTNFKEIYKCEVCGNIVEVLHVGQGELVCCGQPMVLQNENMEDMVGEKHVPILEKAGTSTIVKVGEIPHPMEEEHYIEWIEVILKNGKSCRVFLKPNQEPKAIFDITEDVKEVREYCNIHGLWVNN